MTDLDAASVRTGNLADVGDGIHLHYACAGRQGAPLILFLHGFPEFWFAWNGILPHFGRNWYAVAPDQRGYNLSSRPEAVDAYRIDALMRDVDRLISALGYEDAVIVAHDWGGAMAWSFVLAYPQRVRRLVILNAPHPVLFARALASDPEQQRASQYMNWLRRPGSEKALAADDFALMHKLLQGSSTTAWFDASTQAAYHSAWSQPGALRGGVNWYRATPLHPATEQEPGAGALELRAEQFVIRVPTLIIWGEADEALRPVLLEGIEAFVPQLRLIRVPDASHWIVHEKPQLVCAAIDEFLADGA